MEEDNYLKNNEGQLAHYLVNNETHFITPLINFRRSNDFDVKIEAMNVLMESM